jgi:hypothetical protein
MNIISHNYNDQEIKRKNRLVIIHRHYLLSLKIVNEESNNHESKGTQASITTQYQ